MTDPTTVPVTVEDHDSRLIEVEVELTQVDSDPTVLARLAPLEDILPANTATGGTPDGPVHAP